MGWAADFTYGYFKKVLQAAKSNYQLSLFSQAPTILNAVKQQRPRLLLRHDVDLSLDRALQMAGIESESGVIATYMVMINSPLYDIKSRQSRGTLKLLLCGGHEIGLHFDFDGAHRLEAPSMDATEQKIDSACQRLEDILGASVKSVSFHRPLERFLRGPSTVAGRVNAYSKELMDWYLSDSRGNWREGEPLPKLNNPEKKLLQLLIHPIWWSDHHVAPEDRLEEFFEKSIKGLKPEAAKVFDAALASHLTIQRRGYANVELAKPAA